MTVLDGYRPNTQPAGSTAGDAPKIELGGHARQRALERYGIELDLTGLRALEARLAAGEGMVLRRLNSCEVTVIRVSGQLVTVVFDLCTQRVRTFKPTPDRRFRYRQAG